MSEKETITSTVTVYCTIALEGIHCWPECPFDEVAFLRVPHRHMFSVKAHKQVFHDDRDIEFIMLKRQITDYLYEAYGDPYSVLQFGSMSCEMIAEVLFNRFDLISCDVSEDGENGAVIRRQVK